MEFLRNLKRKLKKANKNTKYKIFNIIGQSNYIPFIVLSRSRTGSNMLMSFLESHPNILVDYEVFSKLNGRSHKEIYDHLFSKQAYNVKARGFKIFYDHPFDDDEKLIWKDLVQTPKLKVIHLKRKNIFRTLISRKIAGIKDVWTSMPKRSSQNEKITISFTEQELNEGFESTRTKENNGDKMFSNHDLLEVYYEDIVDEPKTTFRKVTNFLNIEYTDPKTRLRKQNQSKLSEVVENYHDLKTSFQNTKWESFFNE